MRALALLAVALLGCGLRPSLPAPRRPLAATPAGAVGDPPTEPMASTPFRLRLVRRELSNGLRVVLSRGEPNGVATVVFVSRATPRWGADVDPEVTSQMARGLFRAVQTDGGVVDDPMERELADPTVEALPEGIRITERLPVEELPRYLALLERSLRAAIFRPADLTRDRAPRLDRLRVRRRGPDGRIEAHLAGLLHAPSDPRARGLDERIAGLEGLDADALRRRHRALSDPGQAAIVIAGDIDPAAVLPLVGRRFSAWSGEAEPAHPVEAGYRGEGPRLLLVEEPLVRSFVRVVDRAPPFVDRDYAAFLVLEQLLGRMFGARLNLTLRERRSVSYGLHAAYRASAIDGEIELVTAVRPDRTREVVEQILAELRRVRGDGGGELEPLELSLARTRARETLLATLDTSEGLARAMARRVLAGQEPGAMGPLLRAIDGLDAAAIQAAARRWIRPDRAVFAVVARPDALGRVDELPLGPALRVARDR